MSEKKEPQFIKIGSVIINVDEIALVDINDTYTFYFETGSHNVDCVTIHLKGSVDSSYQVAHRFFNETAKTIQAYFDNHSQVFVLCETVKDIRTTKAELELELKTQREKIPKAKAPNNYDEEDELPF